MSSRKKAQNIQAEHELLLCCARTNAASEVVTRLRELAAAQIDWEYLFLLARRHAVVPLIYLQLEHHAPDLVPDECLQKLKQNYLENSARNTVLTAELCRLITLLSNAGVKAIAYKGPALAVFAYDNLALRRFVDLDVIVKKTDVLQARDILLREGYMPTKSLSLTQQEILLRTQHNMQFSRDERRLIVELHWEIAPHLFASSVNTNTLWPNLITINLNGTQVKTLTAEDLLFSLCVHGSRHLWERLSWICDVAELLARRSFDWSTLLARAVQSDSERMFLLGLYLAEKLLAAPLPNEIKERCDSDNRLRSLANNIVTHLFNGTRHIPATSREIFNYNLTVRKSIGARARYLVHMMRPTDGDLGARSLPSFAYYLTRPLRLLAQTSRRGLNTKI
ncbi:MAG TPA: nucleotidyltransferase family protein [Pyrinomonadaceae bacterium]|nr:nucleotidyltransferase family protein [Pyrinomonadaceae bacterium]